MIPALAIVLAAWILLAALGATGYSLAAARVRRRARRYTDWTLHRPPVPAPESDAEWLSVWPADAPLEVIEQSVFDRLFRDIPEVAADLRRQGAA